jgi:hypothetical protein
MAQTTEVVSFEVRNLFLYLRKLACFSNSGALSLGVNCLASEIFDDKIFHSESLLDVVMSFVQMLRQSEMWIRWQCGEWGLKVYQR